MHLREVEILIDGLGPLGGMLESALSLSHSRRDIDEWRLTVIRKLLKII
jgi:hypothetical protein